MTLSKQQIIDEEAQRVFEPALPPDWIIRKRLPDYRIDYVVEIFEHGESTGLEFAVQLKGTRKPRLVRDTARFSVESSHLEYWMDKTRQPVFLVLIDVQEKEGWWVFTQELVRNGAIRKTWRQQESVTLPLPLTNRLDSIDAFRKAIEGATSQMMSIWPGSIRPAIESEIARLESLDPRFDVKVEATETSTGFRMEAREDVPITVRFRFQPEDHKSKIDDLFARGLPIDLENVEVEASGSDLWTEAASKATKVQFHVERECEARLYAPGQSVALDPLRGKIEGGRRDWRFHGKLGTGVFTFATDILRPPEGQAILNCTWNLDLSKFDHKPLLELPYFDQLYDLFRAVSDHGSLVLEFWWEGMRKSSHELDVGHIANFKRVYELLQPLHWARKVARHFDLSPTLPTDFDTIPPVDIHNLYLLITTGEYRIPGAAFTLTTTMKDTSGLPNSPPGHTIELGKAAVDYQIYDTPVRVEDVEICLTNAVVDAIDDDPVSDCAKVTWRLEDGEAVFSKSSSDGGTGTTK